MSAGKTSADRFQHFTLTIFPLLGEPMIPLLEIIASPESMEESWNMLCLHPILRLWWSKYLFGMKCLDVIPSDERSILRLQFHWMPRNYLDPETQVKPPYDSLVREMFQFVGLPTRDEGVSFTEEQRELFSQLKTGQTFEVLVEKEDAEKMKMALDFQWAVTRLAAISGYNTKLLGL